MEILKTINNKEIITNPNKRQWTLTNMVKTKGLMEFLEALDTFVILSKTPNPNRRNAILLVGDYGSGKTIMVKASMNDKRYNNDFYYIDIKGMFTGFDHKEVDNAVCKIFNDAIIQKEKLNVKFAILFIDEISASIGTRKKASRTQKILIDAILRALTEYPSVILIGTANDISEADESIINSGRLTIVHVKRLTEKKERTMLLKAHIEVVLSYVNFSHHIINNLIQFEQYHDNGWSGRDYEDWTMDVSVFYEINNHKQISLEDFKELLYKRKTKIENKKEEKEGIIRQNNPICIYCGADTRKHSKYKGHQRYVCKENLTCGRTFMDIEINGELYKEKKLKEKIWKQPNN